MGTDTDLRFAGLPLGHEFTSLVLALLWTGGHPPKVEQDVIDQIKALQPPQGEDYRFEVYMSLTCHNCPDVVQALSLMAIQNPRIKTTVIEGGAFQQEVADREIMAVPSVYLNGQLFGNGRMLVEEIVAKLDTGARWRNVNVPGEAQYKNKGVAYCPHCDGPLFKGKRTAVIGGGNSGVEAAIDLAGIVQHVTLVEFADQLKADAVLVNKLKSLPNVTIHANAQTTEITGADGKVNGLRFKDRASGQEHVEALEGVFVQIGLIPNTEWLKGVVDLSKFGEIEVDAKGHTNVPGVFAAGDCTTVPFKQIVIAAGEGSKAALSAFDHLIRSPVAVAA